ncbi:MAG TPA: AsmA family protein [Longimicrobiales bacterium]
MRRSLIIALSAIAVVAVLLIATVLLLPAERVGAFAAERASSALARDVNVERVGVRLFPPAIALESVTIGGPTPGDSVLASADRVELRPRLLPLLRRRVVIDEIALERPLLRIEIAADSTSNLPALTSDEPAAPGGDAELSIRRLQVSGGTLVYRDAITGTSAHISGIDQTLKLSGSIAGGALADIAATGDLRVGDIDVDAPAAIAWPIRDLRLRLEHDIDVDRAADRVDVKRLTLTIEELALDVTGTVTAATDSLNRSVDLRARTGSTDVARLVASLPKTLLENGGEVLTGAAGHVQLDVIVRGRSGAGAVPGFAGTLQLEDAALARGRYGTIADQLAGRIAFSRDSVASTGITGRVLGEPLRASFRVHDLAAPRGTVRIQAALALAQAQKIGLLPDSVQGMGRIALDLGMDGSLVEPAEALVSGTVDLAGVQLEVAALQKPVIVRQGRIVLDGRDASARDLGASIGASDVTLDLDAAEWLPYALGDTLRPPTVAFTARSELFDADEILGARPETYTYGQLFVARLADRPIDGRPVEEVAAEIGFGMPEVPPIDMDGRVLAKRFVRGGLPLQDVDITVAAKSGQLDVRAASFRMMGGGVHMTGRLGLSGSQSAGAGAAQPLALDYTISDVAAAAFLQRFTGFRDQITGDLLIAGTMSMLLDHQLLPLRESVNGAGTLAILEGEIVNWPLLRRLGERIGVAQFDTLEFRDWSGRYRITGPVVVLEESTLASGELGMRAAGSFDVNGTLDLGATLFMPQEWAARVPGAPAGFVASAAAGEDGRVPIGARFGGTARDPSVALDLSEAGARIASAARDAARQQASEAAARAAEQLTGQLPPRDSLSAAADSMKKKVESEVVNRLKRIIKPGGNR